MPHHLSDSPIQQRIRRQRATLYNILLDPMQRAATRCAKFWDDMAALDEELQRSIAKVPYVTYLYALDTQGRQTSANASPDGLIPEDRGRDRSQRPYMRVRFKLVSIQDSQAASSLAFIQ